MASTKYTILVEADLDEQTSQNVIQKKLNAVANIVELELKNVTLSKQALDGMKAQIVSALQGIKIPGGAVTSGSPSTPSAQKTPPTAKPPPASKAPVAPAPPAVYTRNADVANAQGKLQTALRDTNKEMRISWEYTRDMTSGMEKLNGAVVTYTDTAGKERKERYGWVKNAQDEFEWINKSGTAIDDKTKKLNLLQKAESVARSSELKQNGPGGGTSQVQKLATETAKLNTLRADLNAKVVSGAELSSVELQALKAQTAEVGKAIHEVDLLNKSKATTKKADDEIIKKQKEATTALEKARSIISSSAVKQVGKNNFAPEVQTLAAETAKLDALYKSIENTQGGLQNATKAQLDALKQQGIEVDKASKALDISLAKEKQIVAEQQKLNALLKTAYSKADVIPKSAGMDIDAKEVQNYNNALKNLNSSLIIVENSISDTGAAEDWMIQSVKAGENDLAIATADLNKYSGALRGFNAEASKRDAIQSKINQTSSLVQSSLTKTQGMDERSIKEVRDYNAIVNNLAIGLEVVQSEFYKTGTADEFLITALEENKRALVIANGELDRRIKLMREQEKAANAVAREEKIISDQVAKAQKTLDSTNALTTNKSGMNRYVREVLSANKELAQAIEYINEKLRAGKRPNDENLEALEQTRVKSEKAGAALRSVGKDANSWTHEIEIAIKRTIEWAGAMTLIYGSLRQIQLGIEFIRELNKELINVQLVTGASADVVGKLSIEYNNLAKELGATTIEVAKGSLEWARQGKSTEETTALLRASVMMGKLANIEQAQSTEYLTSIINGYKLSMEEVMPVIDKLISLDNSMATSTADLAEAMQKTANVARLAGIPIENLASMLGTSLEKTQKSAETVGEAYKTIFTRMQNVKLGKALSDDGEAISDVERVLDSFGIKLRDSNRTFRNMNDVLNDTMKKWNELSAVGDTVGMGMISVAFAGTRQVEVFKSLMDNQDTYLKGLKTERGSLGLTEERYKIFSAGVEASANRLKDAWDKVWMDTINADTIKMVYDMGTAILVLVSNLGGLIPVLTGVGIAMAYIKRQTIALVLIDIANWVKTLGIGLSVFKTFQEVAILEGAGGIKAFMLALRGYGATLLAAIPPAVAVAVAVAALVGVFLEYKAVVTDVQKSSEKAMSTMFGDLFKNSKDNSSSGIAETYAKAIERMNDAYKDGGILAGLFVNQQALIDDALRRTVEELNKTKGSYADYFAGIMKVMTASGYQLDSSGRFYREIVVNGAVVKTYVDGIKVLTQEQFFATNAIEGTTQALSDQEAALELFTKAQTEYNNQSKAIVDANNLISGLISSYKELGELSLEQVNSMRDMFPDDYTKALYLENGAIKLNVEELKKLLLAKAELAVKTATDLVVKDMDANSTIAQTDATRAHTKALQDQLNIALAQSDAIRNGSFFTAQGAQDAQKAIDDQKKAYDDLLKMALDMIKDRTNAEKDALQKELQAFKDAMDAKKQALQDTADAQKQALQDELDGYKSIIDAQKRLIDLKKAEADQADAVATKNKEISDIDAQLLALQFDNSQEANAQRLKLENDRAIKVKELSTMQNDYSVNNQKDALDQEYALFEKENKAKQSTIDKTLKAQLSAIDKEYKAFEININNKIAELDAYLNQSGTMTQDAINLLKTQSASFFAELINWNKAFGTSVDTDVTDKWKTAFGEMGKYIDAFLFARGIGAFDIGNYYQGSGGAGDGSYYDPLTHTVITPHHSGGFVGDKPVLKNDEEFAKLVKGELVVTSNTMGNFMKNILPNLVGGAVGTIGNISMNFVVQGSLDKSVIPELKDTIIQAVNNVLKDRGVRRNAFSYSV